MKRGACPGDGFLNEIFSVLAVPGELKRRPQQLCLVRQGVALEPLRKLWTHPVMANLAHVLALPSSPVRRTRYLPSIT